MPDGTSKTQELFNDTVIGFNKFDEKVARVTVYSPVCDGSSSISIAVLGLHAPDDGFLASSFGFPFGGLFGLTPGLV